MARQKRHTSFRLTEEEEEWFNRHGQGLRPQLRDDVKFLKALVAISKQYPDLPLSQAMAIVKKTLGIAE